MTENDRTEAPNLPATPDRVDDLRERLMSAETALAGSRDDYAKLNAHFVSAWTLLDQQTARADALNAKLSRREAVSWPHIFAIACVVAFAACIIAATLAGAA